VVRSRGDGTIIGFGGIYQDPFDPGWGAEVGYYFAPETWGQGLASELTQACVGAANDVFSLEELLAFAHPENAASRRVLVKAGFREQRFVPEMNRLLFVLALPGKAV
jgi:RimJ/RimL family protein N-acetyltransferase